MRPAPDESEIRWLLTEASKYLSPEVHMRRKDVLSAWYAAVECDLVERSIMNRSTFSREFY